MKNLICCCLVIVANTLNISAINPINNGEKKAIKVVKTTYSVEEFLNSTNKDWVAKTGKKLKWHEKIALSLLRKKLKKKAKKNPVILTQTIPKEGKTFNFNDFSLTAGIVSVSSVIVLFILPIGFLGVLSLIAGGVAIVAGLIGLLSKQPNKIKSIIGTLLSIGILWLWFWAYNKFG